MINPFPLGKACDSSELPGMNSSFTATHFVALSTGCSRKQNPSQYSRVQQQIPGALALLLILKCLQLWFSWATTRGKFTSALFHTIEKETSEEIKRAQNLPKKTTWVFCWTQTALKYIRTIFQIIIVVQGLRLQIKRIKFPKFSGVCAYLIKSRQNFTGSSLLRMPPIIPHFDNAA